MQYRSEPNKMYLYIIVQKRVTEKAIKRKQTTKCWGNITAANRGGEDILKGNLSHTAG